MNWRLQSFFICACTTACLNVTAGQPMSSKEPPMAQSKSTKTPPPELLGVYFGGFGGWIFPYSMNASQVGTAFFSDANGGALTVNAKGRVHGKNRGFGGLHLGYEWMRNITPNFRLAPAVEVEGYYFSNKYKGHFDNPTTRLDAHEFINTFPMRVGVLLANGILELNNDYLSPYFGVGIGVGFISIHGAKSVQIDPMESGVNHFNSNPSDFAYTFATQAKAGLRYRFCRHYRLFAEYRYLHLTSSDFTFGSTIYPTHVPTSTWAVKLHGMGFNSATFGIDFIF